jgi:protocatechuate 3,4-dioxygenase beta subunit
MKPTFEREPSVSRRQALAWFGAAGLTAVAAACRSGTKASSATTATTVTAPTGASCVLTPEETEGPYYLGGEAIRSDITEGKTGIALRLAFVVLNVNRCAVVGNASVDIWHADATGNYSGFNATASNRTFLRGIQVTDATGAAGFHTIYPGWYQGRATHIHVKVHAGGTVVHTGQLFFDETINQAVYSKSPYSDHSGSRTLNSQDSIYASGGAQSLLHLSPEGTGYVGTITLGVNAKE